MYDEAIAAYKEVKRTQQGGSLERDSDLQIANIYFYKEDYEKAREAYQKFSQVYPQYKQDYVTYQIGESFWKDSPQSPDRDITNAKKSLPYYRKILKHHPKSPYYKSSFLRVENVVRLVFEKAVYIAHFYYRIKKYKSAFYRYEELMRKFPELSQRKDILFEASLSAHHSERSGLAKSFYLALSKKFPNSREKRQLEEMLSTKL